ncbi:MAG TPA: chemotaxis protein CheB [Kineosporiaceae bacterium]|nr:chemotaxis protein CheB [Kineosporiaceae bacterium]
MGDHTVVVVGASAGGVEALRILVAGLPENLPALVLVVLHQPAGGRSALPRILARAGPLPTSHAVHGQALKVAHITIAPPDQHLLVHEDTTALSDGPTEHHHRPAVDPLFRSAARWHGNRVIGVVLYGGLNDGAAGAAAIALRGGVILVQDPDDAAHSSMPRATLAAVPHAAIVPAAELGYWITRLVSGGL